MENCPQCGAEIKVPKYIYYSYDWRGQGERRLFRKNLPTNEVFQLVISPGEKKRGRPHMKGLSVLSYQSFISNYDTVVFRKYLTEITAEKWDEAINEFLTSNQLIETKNPQLCQ